ncbi:hypothetical protein ACQ4PT_065608 [Festuca glaucescens]
MCCDNPKDIREGQLVFIERAVNVGILERDGKQHAYYEDVLAGKHGTTKGDSYLRHDLVYLPTNMGKVHWFLVVVNPRRREIQILNSLVWAKERTQVLYMLRGKEAHLSAALQLNGAGRSVWPDINVTQWPKRVIEVPTQKDGSSCGLYMLKNIEFWTGEELSREYDEDYIRKYRRHLPITFLNSPHNSCKSVRRLKRYHQDLQESPMSMSADPSI